MWVVTLLLAVATAHMQIASCHPQAQRVSASIPQNFNQLIEMLVSKNQKPETISTKRVHFIELKEADFADVSQQLKARFGINSRQTKQLFGGSLPPFIERIIERIQNYFSVYNPPEYFENNRPPALSSEETSASNGTATSIENVANVTDFENAFNECENEEPLETPPIGVLCSPGQNCKTGHMDSSKIEADSNGNQGMVMTQTMIQDTMVNIISPQNINPFASTVIVILEPSSQEYLPEKPPDLCDSPECSQMNKFYVYTRVKVNHTLKTDSEEQPTENGTYSITINKDRIEEYTDNLVREDFRNPAVNCGTSQACQTEDQNDIPGSSKSELQLDIGDAEDDSLKVPNINLVLIPLDDSKKIRCNKPVINNNMESEVYILKPEPSGFLSKNGTSHAKRKPVANSVTKRNLPQKEAKVTTERATPANNKFPFLRKFPVLYRILTKREEEPRNK